jgi:hypothetical protein
MPRGSLVRIVWDDAAVKLGCEQPAGAPARGMRLLADACVLEMKQRCPVYSGPPRGPVAGHPRQTARRSGTLRSSIKALRQRDGSYLIGPTDEVAPGVFLGPMIEQGTPPHVITSHGPWSLYSAATGQYFGPVVHHPGTRPQPFIKPAAEAMNGKRVYVR